MLQPRTSSYPLYSHVRCLLALLDGVPQRHVTDLMDTIWDQTGTPQQPIDWSDPGNWILTRLTGEHVKLADRLWRDSDRILNPRYLYDPWRFAVAFNLLEAGEDGVLRTTERGKAMLAADAGLLNEMDAAEGLPRILDILATKPRARRKDLLPEWDAFVRSHTTWKESTIETALSTRLKNLEERALVSRDGNAYQATTAGVEWAARATGEEGDPRARVLAAVKSFNARLREELRERLSVMPPYRFEQLIRDLLQAMGYDDVRVTKQSGDKGVDVVATVQFGISAFTEVVQVKRQRGSIGRPVLDQLRGVLRPHNALRGTIISLGSFSQGCKDAALDDPAAPIGLIDGDTLLDLLLEHQIGIRKNPIDIYEIVAEAFSAEPTVLPVQVERSDGMTPR